MQSTNTVLMVRPYHFGYNEETAENNAFMQPAQRLTEREIEVRARQEFENLVAALRDAGVQVIVVADSANPVKPDAVFPNNWFSTHADNSVFTYPMYAPTRRAERDNPVLQTLAEGYQIDRTIELQYAESAEQYLEGTGSMVLDRVNKICYVCESERSDLELAARWCEIMAYRLVEFAATDRDGLPVYHTNVIMAIGSKEVVVCFESIAKTDRKRVRSELTTGGHSIIDISFEQVLGFSGNMLEVLDGKGVARWAMSSQAFKALSSVQQEQLSTRGAIIHSDIEAIEQLGGGSARCMIAEIFLDPLTS